MLLRQNVVNFISFLFEEKLCEKIFVIQTNGFVKK